MPDPPLAALIMAGGLGTRMRSSVPKHLHPILGRRLVDWVIASAVAAGAEPVVVVASPSVRDQFGEQPVTVAVQAEPLGTGDAARSARSALSAYSGDVLVLSGDTPLLTPELLRSLLATHRSEGTAATVLTAKPADPRLYGRVVRDESGPVVRIVGGTDATAEERAVTEINSAIYVF